MPPPSPESTEALLQTAETVAQEAGALLAQHFLEKREVSFKGGIDLVTDADTLSEARVLELLRARHPTHAILSEEAGLAEEGSHTYRWIVDPLDGTTNYAHKLPHFSVSIAVELHGQVVAGAVYDPMRRELFSAGRGLGATLNGARVRPSSVTELIRALLCTGFPYNVHQDSAAPLGLLTRMLHKAQGIRRLGSAALDLCYVASGRLDGYFEFSLKPWDMAAGALIVEESGGSMTTLEGKPWSLLHGDVLASAPGISESLKAECQTFLNELGLKGARLQ